ncbi:MAG TPA: tRNA epoxyqueuosine(34) reductase QueG, partial [Terriglobales bacterium]|nr:tRNA epoxyqueuosine(34) reductase QueG [Terriglobales bacterium]
EREAARQAGLGWQAKNTCLIHPRLGSWFFLGSMVTSLDLASDHEPLPDRCGSCTRCIEACPTQALEPYQMDASRCVAYLNIELRGSIPEHFRAAMGNNVLGCDICQQVCPWNQPREDAAGAPLRAPLSPMAEFQPRPGLLAPRLAELAAMTEHDYQEKFHHSAVKRAKWQGLRRNIAVAMGNSGNREFIPTLKGWERDADAVLAEHARWALSQLCAS